MTHTKLETLERNTQQAFNDLSYFAQAILAKDTLSPQGWARVEDAARKYAIEQTDSKQLPLEYMGPKWLKTI